MVNRTGMELFWYGKIAYGLHVKVDIEEDDH
jgi:hypothetical protein